MVAIIFSTFVISIALPPFIPPMVVVDGAARTFPASFEVLATIVVRSSPVRALIRRSRPVAVMPRPASVYWIPVALDPFVVAPRRRRHTIGPWWRRGLTDGDAETHPCALARAAGASSNVAMAIDGRSFLMPSSLPYASFNHRMETADRIGALSGSRSAALMSAIASTR
jgi:hypothetical protein